ncbi:hypothetical protein [Burkholderia gladioli]|uniref:hypothetical protein n=1 Tax=Burkholderia gladioli TaxID=28095 RepID=UPI001FC88F2C|nr:hypothetical protein [Burkholderia gladioli]
MNEMGGNSAALAAVSARRGVATETAAAAPLAEVWGDTVDLRHLGWSVAIGVGVALGAFLAGRALLAPLVADPQIARAYAMLVGLGGCLAAGVICAKLFAPKRVVVEQVVDEAARLRVLAQLDAESGGLGSLEDLSPAARAEMDELGLTAVFAAYERGAGRAAVEAGATAASDAATAAKPGARS